MGNLEYEAVLYTYPVIFNEYNDEDGHYFVISSPNLPGMISQADSLDECFFRASQALELWIYSELADGHELPKVMDVSDWQADENAVHSEIHNIFAELTDVEIAAARRSK